MNYFRNINAELTALEQIAQSMPKVQEQMLAHIDNLRRLTKVVHSKEIQLMAQGLRERDEHEAAQMLEKIFAASQETPPKKKTTPRKKKTTPKIKK